MPGNIVSVVLLRENFGIFQLGSYFHVCVCVWLMETIIVEVGPVLKEADVAGMKQAEIRFLWANTQRQHSSTESACFRHWPAQID